MDLPRSVGRTALPTASAGQNVHSNLISRSNGPGSNQDSLNGGPPPSWHSSRDAGSSGVNSDQGQAQSQFPPYPGAHNHNPATFDGYLQQMTSQSDLLSGPGNPAGSGPLNKKRGRDDHDDMESGPDSGKFHPSPSRIAELTAGFPTPPVSNGPPALITTGRMTKTHADPLIAQLINPDGTPKRPMNAFMIFARKRRPEVAADNPNLRTGEISKLLSAEWKAIDTESKQFYLTKAKELKENFTSIFPTYVYKRRPNNSRKRRKTEETGYGGPGAMNAIDRGEGGLSEDEGDMSPGPDSLSPPMGHAGHPSMGGMQPISGLGAPGGGGGGPRRPGDPSNMHLHGHGHGHHPHHGMVPGPPHHDLQNPYGLHSSQGPPPPPSYGHRGQGSPQMYYDSVPNPSSSNARGSGGSGGGSAPGLWPSLDAKREPKSPRMGADGQGGSHGSGLRIPGGAGGPGGGGGGGGAGGGPGGPNGSNGIRNGTGGGSSYGFTIPSPNFGPGPGLPPIGRSNSGPSGGGGGSGSAGGGGGSGSNPGSSSQTPLLPPAGAMLPPPPATSAGSLYGHGSSHGGHGGHGGSGSHAHAHSGSYYDSTWSRTQQSPSSASLNLNGPSSGSGSTGGGGGAGGPPSGRQTPTSRGRSDSLGGPGAGNSSGSGQWSL